MITLWTQMSTHTLLLTLCCPQTSNPFPSRPLMPLRPSTTAHRSIYFWTSDHFSFHTKWMTRYITWWSTHWDNLPLSQSFKTVNWLIHNSCLGFLLLLHLVAQDPPNSHRHWLRKGCWCNRSECHGSKEEKFCVRVVPAQAEMVGPLYNLQPLNVAASGRTQRWTRQLSAAVVDSEGAES